MNIMLNVLPPDFHRSMKVSTHGMMIHNLSLQQNLKRNRYHGELPISLPTEKMSPFLSKGHIIDRLVLTALKRHISTRISRILGTLV